MSRHDETNSIASRRVARRSPTNLVRLAMLAVSGTLCVATADAQTLPGAGETGGPVKGLTHQEYRLFLKGRKVFDRDFDVSRGLGTPELNADSCRACHEDPVLGGAGGLELNVSRFANDNGGLGPFTNLPGGQAVSKLRPTPEDTRENYPVGNADPLTNADVFEQRQTPIAFGIGAIQTIPAEVILANADPDDLNGDGIKGVARILTIAGNQEVGRFGWKAQVPLVRDFARDAMGGENGITTPDDGRGFAFVSDADAVPDPELSQPDLDALIFFLENLAPPKPALLGGPLVQQGRALFKELRCDRCHIPSLQGSEGKVDLFSDLLLHDVMGPTFRGMSEPGAPSGMFRTPPLWGVKDTAPYMHDGRASTLTDAILAHKGEAEFSSNGFAALTEDAKLALLAFLADH
ncbi:MAG: hypothetical protein FJ296_03905 [Planctomycetes bacterium]|nr:hypothetical protein [Planctomycetota bacterium]